jgi:hypothetical protein
MDELGAALRPYASNAAAASGAVQLTRSIAAGLAVRAVGNLAPASAIPNSSRTTGGSAGGPVRVMRSSGASVVAARPSATLARVIDVAPLPQPYDGLDTTQSMHIQRNRGVRMVSLALLLGVALAVAWHTSATESRPSALAAETPAVAQRRTEPAPTPRVDAVAPRSAEHTAMFTEHAAPEAPQPLAAVAPAVREKPAAEPSAAKPVKRVVRAKIAEPSEHAAPKHAAKAAEPARVERKDTSDGIAIPKANLSKRDF